MNEKISVAILTFGATLCMWVGSQVLRPLYSPVADQNAKEIVEIKAQREQDKERENLFREYVIRSLQEIKDKLQIND